ncbi:MAG: hypothetical protein RL385_4705, partial [Pseudomonadota bacterium]
MAEAELPDDFDPDFYLLVHADVAAAGIDPALHYRLYGRAEGRVYSRALPDDFDPAFYLMLNSDVAAAGIGPSEHYLLYGRAEGRPYSRTSAPTAGAATVAPRAMTRVSVPGDALPTLRGRRDDAFAFLPYMESELSGTDLFKSVVVLGSGPAARDLDHLCGEENIVVALNNAWRAVCRFDHAFYAGDFPQASKPPAPEGIRKGRSSPQYLPAVQSYGGFLYAGACTAFAAGYWIARTMPFAQVSYFASDLVYKGAGDHFYGQGTPDPMRRDISLQDHRAKSVRLFYFGLKNACLFLNASGASETRLGFPRVTSGASLRRNVLAQLSGMLADELDKMGELADAAIALERSAQFDWQALDYWHLEEDRSAWQHVAAVDAAWD